MALEGNVNDASKTIVLGLAAVGRQPELRGQLQGMMWLGFALTEAIVFYALGMAFVAFAIT